MYGRKKFELLKHQKEVLELDKNIAEAELMLLKTRLFKNVFREPFKQTLESEIKEPVVNANPDEEIEEGGEVEPVKEVPPLAKENSELRVVIRTMIKLFYHYLDERVHSQENELLKEEVELSNKLLAQYEREVKRLTNLYKKEKEIKIFRGNLKEKMTEKMAELYKQNQKLKEFKIKYDERIQEEFEEKQTKHKNVVLQKEVDYLKNLSQHYFKALDELSKVYNIPGVIHGKLLLKTWKQMIKKIVNSRPPEDDDEKPGYVAMYKLLFHWNVIFHNVSSKTLEEKLLHSETLRLELRSYGKTVARVFDKFKEGKEKMDLDGDLVDLTNRFFTLFPSDLLPSEAKKYRYCGHSLLYLVRAIMIQHEINTSKAEPTELQSSASKSEETEGEVEEITKKPPDSTKNVIKLYRSQLVEYVIDKKLGSYCVRNIPEIQTVLVEYTKFMASGHTLKEWKEMEKQLFRCLYYMKNRLGEIIGAAKNVKDEGSATSLLKKSRAASELPKDKGEHYRNLREQYTAILEQNKGYLESKKKLETLTKNYSTLKRENNQIELSKKQLQSDFRVFQHTHDRKLKKSKGRVTELEDEVLKSKKDRERMDEDREKEMILLKAKIQKYKDEVSQITGMQEKIAKLEKKVKNPTLNPQQLQALQMNTTIYTNLLKRFHYVYLMSMNEQKRKFMREVRQGGATREARRIQKAFEIRRELWEAKKRINLGVLEMNVVDLTSLPKPNEGGQDEEVEGEGEEEKKKKSEEVKVLDGAKIREIVEREYPKKILNIQAMIQNLNRGKILGLRQEFSRLATTVID